MVTGFRDKTFKVAAISFNLTRFCLATDNSLLFSLNEAFFESLHLIESLWIMLDFYIWCIEKFKNLKTSFIYSEHYYVMQNTNTKKCTQLKNQSKTGKNVNLVWFKLALHHLYHVIHDVEPGKVNKKLCLSVLQDTLIISLPCLPSPVAPELHRGLHDKDKIGLRLRNHQVLRLFWLSDSDNILVQKLHTLSTVTWLKQNFMPVNTWTDQIMSLHSFRHAKQITKLLSESTSGNWNHLRGNFCGNDFYCSKILFCVINHFLLAMTSHLIIQIQYKKLSGLIFMSNFYKMMKTKSISKCIENHQLNISKLSIKAFYLSNMFLCFCLCLYWYFVVVDWTE